MLLLSLSHIGYFFSFIYWNTIEKVVENITSIVIVHPESIFLIPMQVSSFH